MNLKLTRAELRALPRVSLRAPRRLRASVERVEWKGRSFVLKDVSRVPAWVRFTIGRFLIRHELRIYRSLDGLRGVPRLVHELDKDGFVTEFLDGQPLMKEVVPSLPSGFFRQLDALVAELHGRGVFHLDLAQRRNILALSDGCPGIVDFETALRVPFLPALLTRVLAWVDHRGVLKQKVRYGRKDLVPGDVERYARSQRIRRLWFLS
jgi:predicted Ser/Thr protein kinase